MKMICQIKSLLNISLRVLFFSLMLVIIGCDSSSGGGDKIVQPDPVDENGQDDPPPS